ncbi:MAG: hypothetical protein U0T82_16625 [Bacteroidales bacterium]
MKKSLFFLLSPGRLILLYTLFFLMVIPISGQKGPGKSGKKSFQADQSCRSPLVVSLRVADADSTLASFSAARPLDTITFLCLGARVLEVYDGAGNLYLRKPVMDMGSFIAGGALGKQRMQLLDQDGKELKQFAFFLDAKTSINDGGPYRELFDLLYKGMCVYSPNGVESSVFNGKTYNYFVSWVLDNYNTNLGMRYFSPYASGMIDLFSQVQWNDGMIPSNIQRGRPGYYDVAYGALNYVKRFGDVFFVRQPNENHVEYLFVNLFYKAWQATGDDIWMKSKLQTAERALDYSVQDSLRWSTRFKLLKRPYTIDSWDFQVDDKYTPQDALTPTMCVVPGKTKFGIFYGDNTGYAEACRQLAVMMRRAGDIRGAEKFEKRAVEITTRLNALAWNGHFFTHFIDEDPSVQRDLGVDEKSQISQFNAYSINRGLSHEQNVAIIKTYLNLRDNLPPGSPGEWYSIYPPFERGFGGHNQKWQYMNGGIAGHAIGELARGAYENGYEEYGSNNLDRLLELGTKYGKGERIWFAYTGAYPPPPAIHYTPVDISPYANMDTWDKGSSRVPRWMVEQEGNDMRNLPVGLQTFSGVPFLIADPANNDRRSVIGLSGQLKIPENFKHWDQKASGESAFCINCFPKEIVIPVNANAGAIHLLHTIGTSGSEGVAALVEFQYADGSSRAQYLMNGKHITGWWFPDLKNNNASVAWRGPNLVSNDVGMVMVAIPNPEPGKKISKLRFRASEDRGIYVLAALTLADNPPYNPHTPQSYGGPDNWAAALGMAALVEGLAGVTDQDVLFKQVRVAPRWITSRSQNACVTIRYAASDGYVAYTYSHQPAGRKISITLTGGGEQAFCHLLLPPAVEKIQSVLVNGVPASYMINQIENSQYADLTLHLQGLQTIELNY